MDELDAQLASVGLLSFPATAGVPQQQQQQQQQTRAQRMAAARRAELARRPAERQDERQRAAAAAAERRNPRYAPRRARRKGKHSKTPLPRVGDGDEDCEEEEEEEESDGEIEELRAHFGGVVAEMLSGSGGGGGGEFPWRAMHAAIAERGMSESDALLEALSLMHSATNN